LTNRQLWNLTGQFERATVLQYNVLGCSNILQNVSIEGIHYMHFKKQLCPSVTYAKLE